MYSRLNPHVVGRFFRETKESDIPGGFRSLNPHVVGRFFRVGIVRR